MSTEEKPPEVKKAPPFSFPFQSDFTGIDTLPKPKPEDASETWSTNPSWKFSLRPTMSEAEYEEGIRQIIETLAAARLAIADGAPMDVHISFKERLEELREKYPPRKLREK